MQFTVCNKQQSTAWYKTASCFAEDGPVADVKPLPRAILPAKLMAGSVSRGQLGEVVSISVLLTRRSL